MRPLLMLLLLFFGLPVMAQIYKYTDANGHTAYSNQPPEGIEAQRVDLPTLNRVELQPSKPAPATEGNSQKPVSGSYEVLKLDGLPDDGALRANNGTFSVQVMLSPRLQPHHSLRLVLDSQPYGQPVNVTTLQLVNIDRGEHSLAIQVIEGHSIVQQSPTVTFTLLRAHKP